MTRLNTKVSDAEMGNIRESARSIWNVAWAIHDERHQPEHNSFNHCPFFPCNLAADVYAEIDRECKRKAESK